MLVGNAVSVPFPPDVTGCDSCCMKLRIATPARKSSIDNVLPKHVSSGSSDDLVMFPIYVHGDARASHQQKRVCRFHAGFPKRSTTSCGEY